MNPPTTTNYPPPQHTADDPAIAPPLRRPAPMAPMGLQEIGGLAGLLGGGARPEHTEAMITAFMRAMNALEVALASAREDVNFWRARAIELEGKLAAK